MQARYLRLFADEHGESHFADVCTNMQPRDFAPPAAPLSVAEPMAATSCYFFGADSNWQGATPHPTPQRQLACVLRGRCLVTASDGDSRELAPGDVLLLEDTTGKGHATRVLGDEPVLLLGIRMEDVS
jgi:hypothetical protein